MNDANPLSPFAVAVRPALICFSHLRWDFVWQRPQHLMSRFADSHRLFFWEEAIPTDHHLPYLEFHAFAGTSVQSVRPRVPARWSPEDQARALSGLLDQMMGLTGIHRPILWFYTPMMWPIAAHVDAAAVVYDCMDELSAFRFAAPDLVRNEAALMAARRNARVVEMQDFEKAKDKIFMGPERKSMVMPEEERRNTAYHESGHALIGKLLPKCDPVYKATIIPRGGALGMVVSLPEMDRLNYHKDEAKQKITMTMAGKAAEIIKYGEEGVSNGPAGDIQQASALARAMVMRW